MMRIIAVFKTNWHRLPNGGRLFQEVGDFTKRACVYLIEASVEVRVCYICFFLVNKP